MRVLSVGGGLTGSIGRGDGEMLRVVGVDGEKFVACSAGRTFFDKINPVGA